MTNVLYSQATTSQKITFQNNQIKRLLRPPSLTQEQIEQIAGVNDDNERALFKEKIIGRK